MGPNQRQDESFGYDWVESGRSERIRVVVVGRYGLVGYEVVSRGKGAILRWRGSRPRVRGLGRKGWVRGSRVF